MDNDININDTSISQCNIDYNHSTTQDQSHNSNMIELLDGSLIEGYPIKDTPVAEYWKGMRLDQSGQYFIILPKKTKQMNPRQKEALEAEKFFLDHAFFFLANSKRILSDSRMFLSPVPVHSGIAYTGSSGFTAPTLGVYIEWWLNTPSSLVEKKGYKYLTWHIAGSPLSGSNRCSIVDEQGQSHIHSFCGFSKLWSSFVKINTRYQPYKGTMETYTLEQVYKRLTEEDDKTADDANQLEVERKKNRSLIVESFFLHSQCMSLATELSKKEARIQTLSQELVRTRISSNEDKLKEVYLRYTNKRQQLSVRQTQLRNQRSLLRKRLRSGELTPKEFQSAVGPINKELNQIKYFSFDEFDSLCRKYQVQLSDVIDYFQREEEAVD